MNPSTISFKAKPFVINETTVLHLPPEANAKIPTRGLAMAKGTINGVAVETTLEPDGQRGHWFEVTTAMQKDADINAGDTAELVLELTKNWMEPPVPTDIAEALAADATANALWTKITPMARWEWIRWIRATNNPETRAHHIEVARSKLRSGMRRPCCFNTGMCTDFTVSKSGVLLEPTPVTA